MKWILVLVALHNGEWITTPYGDFVAMDDCFWARDYTVKQMDPELYNFQAVCVKVKNDNQTSEF